ncbi:uncharacterized protein CTRU02_207268 [Colletotrichum truncatum]|uniref:Uncharacterized protein n=1 Tax=Colletotrichum truncatum TaxID=5467 RepID=A0ACC3Z0B3_COLTU|nr:uncharacterized protein CTRU02_01096 [Colletotrichum truncatum]KAF6800691.1 hypothetical protein CTRU02_01096 [Colletotrichum truncatum]
MDWTKPATQHQRSVSDFTATGSTDWALSHGSQTAITSPDSETSRRQIQQLTQRITSTLSTDNVDAAYKEYAKVKDHISLCRSLLSSSSDARGRVQSGAWPEAGRTSRASSLDGVEGLAIDPQSSLSSRNLPRSTIRESLVQHSKSDRGACLSAVRDWKGCIESLLEALRNSLAETYRSYDPSATPGMVDSLLQDNDFRASAIQQMRNAIINKTFSPSPAFSRAKYDVQFRNYDAVKQGLLEVTRVLQLGESGLSGDRPVKEYEVSPRGDAILEFANIGAEFLPVLRFRVSSFMLAETSPIFERMFTSHAHVKIDEGEDVAEQLPPPPTPFICEDRSEAKLYRMPQIEDNKGEALKILLHAAHMHNDKVPREVSFAQFVAIAEVCLRYRCTSPLELYVEHRWLPQWIHKGTEDMPDGLLLVSYVFGLRQLFTRMSKTIILNLVDEKELQSKPWPQKVKDKIWAVRGAKMAQLHTCCVNTIQEYLRPPSKFAEEDRRGTSLTPELASPRARNRSPGLSPPSEEARPTLLLSSSPRCPRGNHWCDATNLGWLMLVYGELQLLPTIMKPTALGHLSHSQQPPRRSLAQLVDMLRTIASPPHAIHKGGVCDPAPQFRAAIHDIYNSVSGLTLHDVSGRAHGWVLSRHRSEQPQAVLPKRFKERVAEPKRVLEVTDEMRLKIMRGVDTVDDLHAVAMTDKSFYRVYKENELGLIRKFIKAHRRMTLMKLTSLDVIAKGEGKVVKQEGDVLKAEAEAEAATRAAEEFGGGADGEMAVNAGGEGGRVVGGDSEEDAADSAVHSPRTPAASDDLSPSSIGDEEAQRILWPDSPSPGPSTRPLRPMGSECGMREKFRRSDPAFVEEKMLLEAEDKQLGVERDRRVGLVREDG